MNRKELEAFAREAAKSLKTEKDLSDFSRMLKKITVEAALNAGYRVETKQRPIAATTMTNTSKNSSWTGRLVK